MVIMLYEVVIESRRRESYFVDAENGIDAMNKGYDLFLRGRDPRHRAPSRVMLRALGDGPPARSDRFFGPLIPGVWVIFRPAGGARR